METEEEETSEKVMNIFDLPSSSEDEEELKTEDRLNTISKDKKRPWQSGSVSPQTNKKSTFSLERLSTLIQAVYLIRLMSYAF